MGQKQQAGLKTVRHNATRQSGRDELHNSTPSVYHEFPLERKASSHEIPDSVSDVSIKTIQLLTGLVVRLDWPILADFDSDDAQL